MADKSSALNRPTFATVREMNDEMLQEISELCNAVSASEERLERLYRLLGRTLFQPASHLDTHETVLVTP